MTDTATRTHGLMQRLLEYITANPGKTSLDAAADLGIGDQQAASGLSYLHDHGRLTRQRKGRCYVYILAERADDTPRLYIKADDELQARYDNLQADFDALQELHDELLRWKANAIAKHPDLDIDPLLLKAREIVAAVTLDLKTQEQVRVGTLDHDLGVRAVLMALRSKEA